MALQLTGAYKRGALANLQVRLPAVVIGGGLTAHRHGDRAARVLPGAGREDARALRGARAPRSGEDAVRAHVRRRGAGAPRRVRSSTAARSAPSARARPSGRRAAGLQPAGRALGRRHRSSTASACSTRPRTASTTRRSRRRSRRASRSSSGPDARSRPSPTSTARVRRVRFDAMQFTRRQVARPARSSSSPARTVCVAAGTTPNVTYETEHPGTFELDAQDGGSSSRHVAERGPDGALTLGAGDRRASSPRYAQRRHGSSRFYGDNHPKYAGNVVKAMASREGRLPARRRRSSAEVAATALGASRPRATREWRAFVGELDDDFLARVVEVNRLTPTIVEVVVKAPAAARKFQPGQFYRLQNFETTRRASTATRPRCDGGPRAHRRVGRPGEGPALADRARDGRLLAGCARPASPGEPVVVMGPTGTPTEIPHGETVLLAGGGLGNAVLFSIAQGAARQAATRSSTSPATRTAPTSSSTTRSRRPPTRSSGRTDTGAEIAPRRPQDAHFRGNIVQAMIAYAKGELGDAAGPAHDGATASSPSAPTA